MKNRCALLLAMQLTLLASACGSDDEGQAAAGGPAESGKKEDAGKASPTSLPQPRSGREGLEAGIKCRKTSDCGTGQICCSETQEFGSLCQAGPCGKTLLGYPVQLCGKTEECVNRGDTCEDFTISEITVQTCQAAAVDGGASTAVVPSLDGGLGDAASR